MSKPAVHAPVSSPPAIHPWRGRLLVMTAALLWSTSGFFAKSPVFVSWPQSSRGGILCFWRSLAACLILAPLVRRPQWKWGMIPLALCFVAMMWTYLTAMTDGKAATAIWLQNTAPVWILIVGVSFFGEKLHRRDLWMVACVALGLGTILYYELQGAQTRVVWLGLISGFCYAGVVISLRQLREVDSAWLMLWNHGSTAICMSPWVLNTAYWPQGVQWLYLLCFGMLQIGISYVLFARGLRHISGHEAGGIALIEPVLVPIWTWLVSGEQVSTHVLIGAALIFLGLVVRYAGASTPPTIRPAPQS